MTNKNAYAQSGVDVEAGYEVVERIKKHVARTERAGVMGALGGFGGMFDLSQTGVKEPVLILVRMGSEPSSCWPFSMTSTIPLGRTVWLCVSMTSSLQGLSPFTSWTILPLGK